MNKTIAIIGAGHMGTSLLGGLVANHYPSEKCWITDTDIEKLSKLRNQWNIHTSNDNAEAIANADVVILAVKPNILASVSRELAAPIQQYNPLIISIAAGIPEASIQKWLGGNRAIVRAMPNTPALIGCGATALYANQFVSEIQHSLAESILRAVGLTVWIEDEKLMHVITPFSGSGPAYFFLIIDALQNAAIELGVPPETARLLILQTAYGASRMALESDKTVIELLNGVALPGGTTEKAIAILEENNIREIFKKALMSAQKRSEEMTATHGNE